MSADATLSTLGEAALDLVRRGFAVIPLKRRAKVPLTEHGCKDWTLDEAQVTQWWTRWPEANIGIVCGAPSGDLLVIDLDCHDDDAIGMDTLNSWTREHGELPETVSAVTGSGGYHLFYRMTNAPVDVNRETGVDLRGDGGYVVAAPSVHGCGNAYEWETPPSECEVAEADDNVRAFVQSVQKERGEGGRYIPPDVYKPHERNDGLYHEGCSQRAKGLDDGQLLAYLIGINRLRCEPPLDDDEVAKIARSICEHYEPGHSAEFDAAHPELSIKAEPGDTPVTIYEEKEFHGQRGKFLQDTFGDILINDFHLCRLEYSTGDFAIWTGEHYDIGWDNINKQARKVYRSIRKAEKAEVLDFINDVAPVRNAADPMRYIGFKNGVYDIQENKLIPHSPDLIVTSIIPHDFDPHVDTTRISDVLLDFADGDVTTRQNLKEIIGMCMLRTAAFTQCGILIGEGGNGKSVFLDMLRALLGRENYCSISLSVLGKQFQTTPLIGKLANIADEITGGFADQDTLNLFKTTVAGNPTEGEYKYGPKVLFDPYATFVFASNEFPRLADTTKGLMRRLFPIPFTRNFDGEGCDVFFSKKVTDEDSCEQLIMLGIDGLITIMSNRRPGFTPNQKSEEMLHEIRLRNDSVEEWIAETEGTREHFKGMATCDAYSYYSSWCELCKIKAKQFMDFEHRMLKRFNFSTAPGRVPRHSDLVRVYVDKEVGS